MKTKIKRHYRSAVSILLSVCMLISCMTVGLIATDAARVSDGSESVSAKADSETVGYGNTAYVKGSWDKWSTPDDSKGHNFSSGYTVSLAASTTYEFCFVADNGDIFKKDMTITDSINNYDFPKSATNNAKLTTTVAGNYTFQFKGFDGGQTSMKASITYPKADPDTWTVIGGFNTTGGVSNTLFGTTWEPTLTANDMTETTTGVFAWTKNHVLLDADTTIQYKVAKNHATETTFPAAANQTETVSTTGMYNVTVTYDTTASPNTLAMVLTPVTRSTLTVGSVADAEVTATYNGTTAAEGQTISNIPEGDTVWISVTPNQGHQCTAVTSSGGGNVTGSELSWSLTMPGAATTVSATIADVTMGTVYFNNNYTLYSQVYAYVRYDSGSEPLGSYPGKIMTKLDNSNIWSIDIPRDITLITFRGDDGVNTNDTTAYSSNYAGMMTIPWTTYNNKPRYTAPYGSNNAPTVTNGGTWGEYKPRTNEYTVTDGTTMSASNLFTGISATFYDYYTDSEISTGKWIEGIANSEYNWKNDNGFDHNPYENLNTALSNYAKNNVQPTYDITYPLYFGTLNYWGDGDHAENSSNAIANDVSTYYHFYKRVNHSAGLSATNNAITGLTGKSLANGTIHHYKSGATNEDGAPMAIFNEDFLSGENSQNKTLATILRSSSFPVRKTDNYGAVSDTVWLDENGKWNGSDDHGYIYAWVWGEGKTSKWVKFTNVSGSIYKATGVSGYTGMHVYSLKTDNVTAGSTTYGTPDIAYSNHDIDHITISLQDKAIYKLSSHDAGAFTTHTSDTITLTGGYTYYEFNSTNGQDNAYITNVNKTSHQAKINYYNNDNKVHSAYDIDGFFPFNRVGLDTNDGAHTSDITLNDSYAKDLGFGAKLEIKFTINENGLINTSGSADDANNHQKFNFSGDDDLWVFVDDQLVLDLGGAHGATTGSIDFATTTVTANNAQSVVASGITRNGNFGYNASTNPKGFDKTKPNQVHTMTIYYMERGMDQSNLRFGFSFHAVPNVFSAEKKVRTKNINAGFYTDNGKTGAASNVNQTLTAAAIAAGASSDKKIYNFEASYQTEAFNISTSQSTHTLTNDVAYSKGAATGTLTPASGVITYPLANDDIVNFLGQFTSGDTLTISEAFDGSNKYVYDPSVVVYDDANNSKEVTGRGDAATGYSFTFSPTTNVTGGFEVLNLRARFTNQMKSHNLTLTKELINATDTTTPFTYKILFKFDYTDGANTYNEYIAYPLTYSLNGQSFYDDGSGNKLPYTLTGDGELTLKAGDTVIIPNIPENAQMIITEAEPATPAITDYRYDGFTLKNGSTDVTSTATVVSRGAKFAMSTNNMYFTITNRKPNFGYTLKYTYPAYVSSYGNQSYTVKGVFTETEKNTYLTVDANGEPIFKSSELKQTFVNNKAPYEDNFQQTLSFASSEIDDTSAGKGWSNDNYTCELTALPSSNNKINVRFNLPYSVDSNLVPQEKGETHKIEKIAATEQGSKNINCFDWYVTAGKTNINDETTDKAAVYVKAPLIVYSNVSDETTKQYFQYWQVSTQSSYGMTSTEYTRCYDYEFNFALFTDCVIEPVYAGSWAQTDHNPNPPTTYNMYSRYDAEQQILNDSTKGISIAFLENSRNQYNSGDHGTRPTSTTAADVIYSDFLLNFNYVAGLTKLKNLPDNQKKAGLVIEAVDYMAYIGTTTAFDAGKNYSGEEAYTTGDNAEKSAAIKAWLEGGDKPAHCVKSEFDANTLDNKNCKQYYYALNNRSVNAENGQLINNMQNRYKVFRAYAYIGDVSDSHLANVTVSAPVYFTIYDVASQGLADNVTRS